MDIAGFCTQSAVIIVAGKGGVGKTTVSAALARTAARSGLSVLIVELEGKSGLTSALGHPELLTYDEVVLSPGGSQAGSPAEDGRAMAEIRARTLTPDDALLEYLVDHGLRRVSKRLVNSGALDVVATAVPGIRDILVLGKVKQLERSRRADVIVVDAPAAGHAITFLTSAQGLLDSARAKPTPCGRLPCSAGGGRSSRPSRSTGWPTAFRCRSCGCRTCSRPSSACGRSTSWRTRWPPDWSACPRSWPAREAGLEARSRRRERQQPRLARLGTRDHRLLRLRWGGQDDGSRGRRRRGCPHGSTHL